MNKKPLEKVRKVRIESYITKAERAVTYPEGSAKSDVANAGEMLDSIDKAHADINNAVSVAGTTLNTANEKLGEINTVSAEKLQEMQGEVSKATEQQQAAKAEADRAKAEVDRAQPLPVVQVIHGFLEERPCRNYVSLFSLSIFQTKQESQTKKYKKSMNRGENGSTSHIGLMKTVMSYHDKNEIT